MEKDSKVKVISHKIPQLTKTAMVLANANHQANVQEIVSQTLEILGLNVEDKWHTNFDTGFITREVPDNA